MKGYKSYQYLEGSPDEILLKTQQLRDYAEIDPSQSERIKELTNKYVAKASSSAAWRGSRKKDLYALGQDAYLLEMGRMGLRDAYETARR